MDCTKFLNLWATILRAAGVLYVTYSIATMSPEDMRQLAMLYWDSSVPQMEALANKKGEAIVGLGFILLSCLCSGVAIMRNSDDVYSFPSKWLAFTLAVLLTIGLGVPLHCVGQYFYYSTKHHLGTSQPLNSQ